MTFGFLVGSRNFIRLFWVSCEVFVLWLCRTSFIDQIFSENLQLVRRVMQQIALNFFASFIFLFSVSVGLCSGFPRSSSLILPLLSGTGFSVYLLTSNTESCDEDDDVVGVGGIEELVDKQGLRMAHSLIHCNQFNCHFGRDVVL